MNVELMGAGSVPYSTVPTNNTVASCHSVTVRHTAAVVSIYLTGKT